MQQSSKQGGLRSSVFIEEVIFTMDIELKGYYVPSGYMGWTGKRYQLFASEADYEEYMEG